MNADQERSFFAALTVYAAERTARNAVRVASMAVTLFTSDARFTNAREGYRTDKITQRTRDAMHAKRLRGERLGTVPFGFRVDANGQLLEDETEQSVIAVIRALHDQGLSTRKMVAELAARGIVSRRGKPLGKTQVHAQLSRIRGKADYGKKTTSVANGDAF